MTPPLEYRRVAPDADWDAVVAADGGQVFASTGYLGLIGDHLGGSQARHLGAFRAGRLMGVMPSFTRCVDALGCVNNSSPYFGSHGGVYTTLSGADRAACVRGLLDAWTTICATDDCAVGNVVEPLGNRDKPLYASRLAPWRMDERVGQIVERITSDPDEMLSSYHHKTRNMLRKAERLGVRVRDEQTALDFLHEVHVENLAVLGGRAKASTFFEAIPDHLGDAWSLHTAHLDGERIAALLVLYFADCAEYYTPVTRADFRTVQPMTLLVHHAITSAAARGCRRFNFGGTWHTQAGVHRFKSRFGATDRPYRYYIRRFRADAPLIRDASAVEAFDGYYLYPFDR
jgi:GNAT acetyltransferase-like protein